MRLMARGIWVRLAVGVAFAAFATVSFKGILDPAIQGRSFDHLEPSATTDSFLRILDAPRPAMLVEGALRTLPLDTSLLFVAPAKEEFKTQVFYSVAYLAYPRRVAAIFCGGGKAPEIWDQVPQSSDLAAVIFFATDPGPWARDGSAGGTSATPKLYVARHHGAAQWASFCR